MRFGRLLTAMVTPFKTDLSVDFERVPQLVEKLIAEGSDGLVVCGTTGEASTLTHEEEFELFRLVKDVVAGRISVVAGTGSNSTKQAIKSTTKAEEIGVDGALLVTPYYNKPTQEGLYQHYRAVAKSTSLPLILYNIPGRCVINMTPATTARLAEIPNIVASKEASGSLSQIAELRSITSDDYQIYSGDDALTLPILSVGGCGVICVASHVAGLEIKTMIDAYFAGEIDKAAKINASLVPLFKALAVTTNPIPVKAALDISGFSVGGLRLPLTQATEAERKVIADALEAVRAKVA